MTKILGPVVLVLLSIAWGFPGQAGEADAPAACYDLRVETLMPHLEENLRYANTQETQCVTRAELHQLFPVLAHPALAGCHLADEKRIDEGWSLELTCSVDHGTHGTALWQTRADGEIGELTVRLGGKNMTFSQRLTARLTGRNAESH